MLGLLVLSSHDGTCVVRSTYLVYDTGSIFFFFSHTFSFQLLDKPWSQVSSLVPPWFLPTLFIAQRVQQSHCSSIFHRVLLTHALALSASQFVHKKKSQRIYTSMHSAGLELTTLTYTRFEDNLIHHRGDRFQFMVYNAIFLDPFGTSGKQWNNFQQMSKQK